MKSLKNYILESFKINKNTKLKSQYKYFPKTLRELKSIIFKRIKNEGIECDLNDIDTSKIQNMHSLFYFTKFNGDIYRWDVSNVKDMTGMFAYSKFNGDISNWNVSKVKFFTHMFFNCGTFNQNISNWDISNAENTENMFENCPIEEKYKPSKI